MTQDAIGFITPVWAAPSRVRVLQTTRVGGASASPYDSLNLGLHVGDDPEAVARNRTLLSRALPDAPCWLRQVHGTHIVEAGDARDAPHEADGAATCTPERVVGVMTADCLPVVVANAAGTRVCVVHAGWRGLAEGIVRAAIEGFGTDDALHAWLGPAIGPDAFEVGAEVREAFVRRDENHAPAFRSAGADGKYLADLYLLARTEIARTDRPAPVHVTGGDRCTFTEADTFYSHRRDGPRTGRMGTFAWLERS